jgi:hypothetical protein
MTVAARRGLLTAEALYANGKKLEGFPVNVPKGLYPERASLLPGTIEMFERNGLSSADDVLCARRIFVFELA